MKVDIGLLLLRLVFGGAMLFSHGYPKLTKYSELAAGFPDPLGVGVTPSLLLTLFAELICALAIVAGFFTRWAAVPLAICMAVAAFVIHSADPFGKKEMALLYLAAFVVIALLGPGRLSADRAMGKA